MALALMLPACTPLDSGSNSGSNAGLDAGVGLGPWKSTQLRGHPLVGRIWVPGEDRYIEPGRLLKRMAAAKYLLLGERHDNRDHHRIQSWITARLIDQGRKPALVMEMFRASQQRVIDAHLKAHPGDSAGLGKATGWDRSGWPKWRYYEPIVRPAIAKGYPVIAANLSRATIRGIYKEGLKGLPPKRLDALNLRQPVAKKILSAMDREIVDVHCGLLKAARARPFTQIQLLRDAEFARAMRRAGALSQGAILISGTGHARRDRGVPFHLRRAGIPPDEIFALGVVEVAQNEEKASAYAAIYGAQHLPFDAVWFTPRHVRADPCAKYKKTHKRK